LFRAAQLTSDEVVAGCLRLWRELDAPRTDAVGAMSEYERIIQF